MISSAEKNKNVSFRGDEVPECTTINQNNMVFWENKNRGLPFLVIKKGRKHGKIEYDFITTYYQLREHSRVEIRKLFEEMVFLSDLYKLPRPARWSIGKVYGISNRVELDICREYAPKIKDILFSSENWEYSYEGRMKKTIDHDVETMLKLE